MRCKIYRLWVVKQDGTMLEYIGNTTGTMKHRMSVHKNVARVNKTNCTSMALYQTGLEVQHEILEEFDVKDKYDSKRFEREQYWMEMFPNRVNRKRAHRTIEQRRQYSREYNKWRYDNDPGFRVLKEFKRRQKALKQKKQKKAGKLDSHIRALTARLKQTDI